MSTNTTIGNNNGTYDITAGTDSIVTVGNGNDTIVITGGTDASITIGSGIDTVTADWGSDNHLTVGGGNDSITVSGGSGNTITAGNGVDVVNAGSEADDTISVGGGNDTISAGAGSTITAGSGVDIITAGGGSSVTATGGNDTVNVGAGSGASITLGGGVDKVTVTGGKATVIKVGNGNETITLSGGSGNTVTAGSGNSVITASSETNDKITTGDGTGAAVTVYAGASSTVVVGNGNDTVSMGAGDTVTAGKGIDTFIIGTSGAPSLTAPAQLSVNEEGSIALPIAASLSATGFGHDTITGFSTASFDKIEFSTSQFSSFAAVMSDARQVGSNTVITVDAADSITLVGVTLSSLTASNFEFVSGGSSGGSVLVTLSGIPSGVSLSDSSGALTVTDGSVTLTTAQLAGLTLKAGGITTATLTATATNQATGISVSQNIALTVNPVAPILAGATAATVNEGGTVTLGATDTAAFSDDTLGTVTITGLPDNLTAFNGGSYTASSGTWTGTAAQFNALSFKAGETGTETLSISATTTGATAAATENYTLTVKPAAPVLAGATAATVSEGGTVTLGATDTAAFGDDTLGTVTITGLPNNLTAFNGGTYTASSGTWTGTAAQFNALSFKAGETGTETLSISATTTGATAAATENYTLAVKPAAPVLGGATAATVSEGGTVTLGATDMAAFGDDTLGTVTITGLPSNLTAFNGGSYTASSGTWTGTAAQFNALSFKAGTTGAETLSISATTTGATAATTENYTLTVLPAAPMLSAPASLTVNEDGTVALPIVETPFNPNDTVSITIAGVPADATLSAGTNNGNGTWTLTPAQLAGLTLTAGEVTTTNLTVTATNTAGQTASTTDTIALTVNPVAPTLAAPSTLTVNADGSIALPITETAFDPRDTVSITVSGVPADATLSAGTSNGSGSWTLTPAQLAGLTLNAGNATVTTLTVTATNTQGVTASSTDAIALTVNPVFNVTLSTVSNLPVQQGQTLVASTTIGGDPADAAAAINYQWQSSSDGGVTWTDVSGAQAGGFGNTTLSSFLQLTEQDEGEQFRVQASFTDSAGNLVTATSAPTVAVADVTPEITVPFSYTVDDLSIVKNGTQIYDNTFSQAPIASPTILSNGVPTPIVFLTNGSTWTDLGGEAVMSSAGVAPDLAVPSVVEDFALLTTNTTPTSTLGLKESAAFTVSSTFSLTPPPPTGGYGMELNDGTATHAVDQIVSFEVANFGGGNVGVVLVQNDPATQTSDVIASQTLTAAQLAGNDQIEFQLSHVANTSAVTGSFELLDDGTVTSTTTFANTAPIFTGGVDWTRVAVGAWISPGVGLNVGAGQSRVEGQTLMASAATNDSDATINYQWQESASPSFATFTDIGTNSASYVVQESDVGSFMRVVATTSDPDNSQSATVTSQVTGTVVPAAPTLSAPASLAVNEDGTIALAITETPSSPNDPVSITITGVPLDGTLSAGTNDGNTTWTLTPAQLAGLTLTAGEVLPPINLMVTATNTAGLTASTTDTIALTVNPVAPTLTAPSTLTLNADSSIALPITETAFDPRDTVSITISGVPADATLSAGTNNGNGSWTLTPAQLGGLTLNAGNATVTTLTVTATNTEGGTASSSDSIALTVNPVLSLTLSTVDNLPVQQGQTLVASATIGGDPADAGVAVAYQWQSSSDGGATWSNVGGAVSGNFNSVLSSLLQLTEQDEGQQFRVQASFTDSAGNLISATSAPTVPVADVTPEITVPFSYTVDDLSIVKNGNQIYNNTFSQAPIASPTILANGVPTPIVFLTLGGTWTESGGQAVFSSAGDAPNTAVSGGVEDFALLNTNTSPQGTGTGESDLGLKEDSAFTVSSTFGLTTPPTGNYGMELNDGTSTHGTDQLERLIVANVGGNTVVELVQRDLASNPQTTNIIASQTLTAAQLAADNQIEFQFTHVANTQVVTGSFELLDNGVVDSNVGTVTLGTSPIFTGGVTWTRVDIGAFTNPGVALNVAAGQSPVEGQTLTASAATNDSDATINYQWQESASPSFATFTDIGTNSPSYVVQESDVGSFIRVVATTSDPDNSQSATVISQVTGTVVPAAPTLSAPASLAVNEDGTIALPIVETPFSPNDNVSITITGVPLDGALSAGTNDGIGTWTLTPAQLAGLTLTAGEVLPPINLMVTATNTAGLTASTTDTIALTVNPVAPTLAAPSLVTASNNGSVALPITVTPYDPRDPVSVTITGIPADATLSDNSGPLAVVGGSITLSPVQLAGLTLTAGLTPATLTVTATNTEGTSASTSETVLLTINSGSAYLWGSSDFPAQPGSGVHIYAPSVSVNQADTAVGIFYGETSSNYSVAGPDVITDDALMLDPFLLPESGGPQAVETSTISSFPFRYNYVLPSIGATNLDGIAGIAIYETQSGGTRYLNEVGITQTSPGSPLTVGTPTQIETLPEPEENPVIVSFRTVSSSISAIANYSVAWDQYSQSAGTYTINFQIFNGSGTASSPVETPLSLTGVGGVATLPAWYFRSGSGPSSLAPYTLAYAQLDPATGDDVVQFQGYALSGAPTATSFSISPDLSAYAPGATNRISLEQNPATHTLVTSALRFAQFSSATGYELAVAWNEQVTDSNGTHDQVEFAEYNLTTNSVVSQQTFQLADGLPQNINLSIANDIAVLEYGDNTATNLVEFNAGGQQLGTLTVATTQEAQSITNFGDGRVGVVYDNLLDSSGTSQLVTDIYDFRTTGVNINDSGLNDGINKYVAGTQYNDIFIGENNVNNTYYYIGQNTTGPGPADVFNGGSGSSWNVAILPDAESNYSMNIVPGVTAMLTNVGDPAHAGTLTMFNVQALAFDPASDPSGNSGSLQATGNWLDIIGPLPGGGEPIGISNGSTLELDTADSGTVTFAGPEGALQLDSANGFTGEVSGFGALNQIDLAAIGFGANTTLGYTANNTNTGGTLTVSDGTHTANVALLGQYMAASFATASDGHGGTLVTDPPVVASQTLLTQPHA